MASHGQTPAEKTTATNSRLAQMKEPDYNYQHQQQQHQQDNDFVNDHISVLKLNESWAGRRLVEALKHLPANHHLGGTYDMRFQQKQMQEREQRRLELTGGAGGGGEDVASTTKTVLSETNVRTIGNGKVRQMFDQRRRGAGIDRSNPLKPIAAMTSPTRPTLSNRSTSLVTNTVNKTKTTTATTKGKLGANSPNATKTITRTVTNGGSRRGVTTKEPNNNPFSNGSTNVDECDMLYNETFPKEFTSLSLKSEAADDMNNNNKNNNTTNPRLSNGGARVKTPPQSAGIKLNPLVMKKSPNATRTTLLSGLSSKSTPTATTTTASAGRKVRTPTTAAKMGQNTMKVLKTATAKKTPPVRNEPPPGTSTCRYCQRNFNSDRLAKHEVICAKMANTKRRIFDAAKHRVKGTEAEKYVRKTRPTGPSGNLTKPPTYMSAAQITGVTVGVKKNNWRQKHEEFIAAIRAAKQVKAHLARGGKLSDLPPPPPSENPDYIQCPHCLRRFNEAAAERHIPKCATMLHNKTKPQQMSRRK